MAIPTQQDIRERIQLILAEVPGIKRVIEDEDELIDDDDLPVAIVFTRGARRNKIGAFQWGVTRDHQIAVLFKRILEWTPEERHQQWVQAEELLELVPDYFNRLDRLALNYQMMDGVIQVGAMNDEGLETRQWGQVDEDNAALYYAATYTLPVTVLRR